MPEGFLCADAVLRLTQNVAEGLRVNEKVIEKALKEYMPFIATENLLMEAVKRGGDRQELHEIIRKKSMEAVEKQKNGEPADLLEMLSSEPAFGMSMAELEGILDPALYTGRCAEQVERFLAKVSPYIRGAESAPQTIEV
jgi:adenylosuccinate lyase